MKTVKQIIFIICCIVGLWEIKNTVQHIQAEYYHRQGYITSERGYPLQGNYNFEKAVKLVPWENHYRLQLAKSYDEASKEVPKRYIEFSEKAIKEFEYLMQIDPVNPWYKARIGILYHERYSKLNKPNDRKLAEKYALAATESDPKNPLFTLHYAHFQYTYDNVSDALAYYKKTLEFDNDMDEAHFNLAAIYYDKNQIKDAIEHYHIVAEKLITLERRYRKNRTVELKTKIERFQNARIRLAEFKLKQNKINEAYELINLLPVSVEKYELLALYYEKSNQINAAISIYKQLNDRLDSNKYSTIIQRLKK